MLLPPPGQYEVATQIAGFIRLHTIGYGAVAARTDNPRYPEAAIVIIARNGHSDRLAKVSVHADRIVYASRTGTHVTYPTHHEDAGRIIAGFLSQEDN